MRDPIFHRLIGFGVFAVLLGAMGFEIGRDAGAVSPQPDVVAAAVMESMERTAFTRP